MEPRTDIWANVKAGRWGEGILLRRATSDFAKLAAYYAAGDLMLHMSVFGESYGYTIAEAMQHSLPLVVRSTPWRDNAQVELVEHGVTGFACGTRQGAAGALLELAANATLRAKFGASGKQRIAALSDLALETELIDELIQRLVDGTLLNKVSARNQDLLAFAAGFPARERRVWEFTSGFGLIRLHGLAYLAYRQLRKLNFAVKAALRRG
jgi:hypothetical protein